MIYIDATIECDATWSCESKAPIKLEYTDGDKLVPVTLPDGWEYLSIPHDYSTGPRFSCPDCAKPKHR